MLRNIKQLEGRALRTRDEIIGDVKDVYFDDYYWNVRYFVVETGSWLDRRRVLIAPESLGPLDWGLQVLPVNLTTDQVRHSPGVDTAKPVSRHYEEKLRLHYGWPLYWDSMFGPGGLAAPIMAPIPAAKTSEPALTDGDAPLKPTVNPHLRSANDTINYHLEAIDGPIGHVHDFLVNEIGWQIRYLVVDARNWWPGKKVLIAPGWIKDVSWTSRSVSVDLTRETIEASPPYDAAAPWDPGYGTELHDYYGRPRYSDWDEDITAGAPKAGRERKRH